MQQHLMQMQPMMGSYYHNNVTTDHIQQYLDENKSLILKIVESQNSGKLSECAENQSRLQRNLMYLAAIADSQPQPSAMPGQFPMQQGSSHYMQAQQMTQQQQQQLIATRSSLVYAQQQQPFSLLQQQQALHTQLGMSSGGNPGLNNMLQTEATNVGGFSDLHGVGRGGLIGGSGKQLDIGSSGGEGHSSGERGETLYLKPANDGN